LHPIARNGLHRENKVESSYTTPIAYVYELSQITNTYQNHQKNHFLENVSRQTTIIPKPENKAILFRGLCDVPSAPKRRLRGSRDGIGGFGLWRCFGLRRGQRRRFNSLRNMDNTRRGPLTTISGFIPSYTSYTHLQPWLNTVCWG